MNENYINYDKCCKHHDYDNDKHKEEKFEDCKCKCIKTLAEELKEFKCKKVTVFEKDAIVFGEVKAVINNSVLVLEHGVKYVYGVGYIPFKKIFISICKITEFIPHNHHHHYNVTVDDVLDNFKKSGKSQIL